MMQLHLAGLLILSAGQFAALAAGKHDAEIQAIRANEARWNREIAAKDVEQNANHYTDDAIVIVPGMPAVTGKEAIRAMFKGMLADPAFSLKFTTVHVEVAEAGDMASTEGSFTVTATDPATGKPVTSGGSYVTVYKKQAGEWKAVFDIASAGPNEQEKKQ
jgi:uncharacterized protein (TIGR02246 family)